MTPHWQIEHARCGHIEDRGIFVRDQIDRRDSLCPDCRPQPASETAPSWRGAPAGIDADEVVRLIRARGPYEIASVLRGGGIVQTALVDGLDLTRWTVQSTAGALVFARLGDDDRPNAPMILCVNAHEERRAEFAAQIDDPKSTVLLMTPDGLRDYSRIVVPDGPF